MQLISQLYFSTMHNFMTNNTITQIPYQLITTQYFYLFYSLLHNMDFTYKVATAVPSQSAVVSFDGNGYLPIPSA